MELPAIRMVLAESLLKASGGALEALKDDAKVRKAAQLTYDALPAPVRLAIRLTVGPAGFEQQALQVRDYMLSHRSAGTAVAAQQLANGFVSEGLAALVPLLQGFAKAAPEVAAPAVQPLFGAPAAGAASAQPRTWRIGRGADADIRIERGFADVSNRHAEISVDAKGRILLVDCGSTNGTKVMEQGRWSPVTRMYVALDQPIMLGAHLVTTAAALLEKAGC